MMIRFARISPFPVGQAQFSSSFTRWRVEEWCGYGISRVYTYEGWMPSSVVVSVTGKVGDKRFGREPIREDG
jgi:hypothetical protein